MENQFLIDSDELTPAALERKHRLENDPSSRTDHMQYMEGQQIIKSDIREKVMREVESYDPDSYTAQDVVRALDKQN
ncbi:MAG: 2-iminoacetate synthase ThiH, partial [Ruminococcus sp.]|nr:2-iminoacetate synthase ThiH [Ruminococcus sp.]